MAVIKARPDAIQNPAPAVSVIKPVQRGTVTMSAGNTISVPISPVNPAKSRVFLTYRNNIGVYYRSESADSAQASFVATAEFINGGTGISIAMTNRLVVDTKYDGSGYTDSWLDLSNATVAWEVFEYV